MLPNDTEQVKQSLTFGSENRSLFMFPTDETESLNVIGSLKPRTSCDILNPCVVKKIARYIVEMLVFLYNASFVTGIFPDSLKTAVVITLLKSKSSTTPSNHWPISLLSCFAKIFEEIV